MMQKVSASENQIKAIPPGVQLTPLLRICLPLFRHTSPISSAEESLLPPQFYCLTKNLAAQLRKKHCAVLP